MSYTKNRNAHNFNARIKKQWKRALKKRRTSEARQARAVADRLLGVERYEWWMTKPMWVIEPKTGDSK